jgi:hypothetical protein
MLLGQCCVRSRFDADHPASGGASSHHIVRLHPHFPKCPSTHMSDENRFLAELYNVLGGLISGVGDVNGHAQLVHSANNLSSEVC